MALTIPRTNSIAGSSTRVSQIGNVTIHTAVLTAQDATPSQTIESVKEQTTDYGEPTTSSCLAMRRKFTMRLTRVFRSSRAKRDGVPLRAPSIQLPDEEGQPVRMSGSEHRGRKTTARLPLGARRPPTLYDDGQGSWVGEFGYIYRGGLDMNKSRLSLAICSETGPAPRCSLEAKDGHPRVDSRTVGGLKDAGDDAVEEGLRSTRDQGEAGDEGDIPRDQQLSGDGSSHNDTEDQHMSNETTEVEPPEERCGPCDEDEDRCEDPECSCHNHDRCW